MTEEVKSFPALLKAHSAEIARALPAHLSADRMARIALTSFRRNPKLAECDPRSVFACVIQSAQLGLEPDTLGRSYLIPYKVNKKTPQGWESHYECQFVPGWKGLVDLMNRSGSGSVWTGAVFSGDEFDYQLLRAPQAAWRCIGRHDPCIRHRAHQGLGLAGNRGLDSRPLRVAPQPI
jgi:recombination protein RecT